MQVTTQVLDVLLLVVPLKMLRCCDLKKPTVPYQPAAYYYSWLAGKSLYNVWVTLENSIFLKRGQEDPTCRWVDKVD